jgi:alpha-galactosidase
MAVLTFEENGLHVALDVSDEGDVRLLHFASVPFDPALVDGERQAQWFRLVEVQATGEDVDDHHGLKHTGSVPGKRLRYVATYDAQR